MFAFNNSSQNYEIPIFSSLLPDFSTVKYSQEQQ